MQRFLVLLPSQGDCFRFEEPMMSLALWAW